MQLLDGVLVALAALVGLAIALSLVMLATASVSKSGPAPQGGSRPDLPQHPQSDTDDARVLVGVR
ncbi:MAG TPA: hypothetical protein VIY52_28825 [Streptosporangiaceae bacterium]